MISYYLLKMDIYFKNIYYLLYSIHIKIQYWPVLDEYTFGAALGNVLALWHPKGIHLLQY